MRLFIFALLFSLNSLSAFDEFLLPNEKLLKIIDGDSLKLDMRIEGIDTPEIGQKCRQYVNKIIDCGQLSRKHLKKILKELPGKITIVPLGFDYYKRILVRVYKANVNIGKLMVEQGMAFAYKDFYKQQEKIAKDNKLGFWGFNTPPINPYKWRKFNRK